MSIRIKSVLYFKLGEIDCLVQDCSISSANALEILQSCTKPSKCFAVIFLRHQVLHIIHLYLNLRQVISGSRKSFAAYFRQANETSREELEIELKRGQMILICQISSAQGPSDFNPSGARTGIFHGNWVNTMAADDLAPCVTRSSVTIVLIMQDKQVLVLHEERTTCTSSVLRNIENANLTHWHLGDLNKILEK